MSGRGIDSYGRPSSRHRHTESTFNVQSGASPQAQGSEQHGPAAAVEPRRRSGGSHPVSSMLEQSESRPSSHSQQTQRDPQYSAGPEMRHEELRTTPEEDNSRRASIVKRDDGRD
jgi:hypothetical protein